MNFTFQMFFYNKVYHKLHPVKEKKIFFYFLFSLQEEGIGIKKNFDFLFATDL